MDWMSEEKEPLREELRSVSTEMGKEVFRYIAAAIIGTAMLKSKQGQLYQPVKINQTGF